MSDLNIAVYAEGYMYPGAGRQPVQTTISQLQKSGFHTAILSLFHIGRDYDIHPKQIPGDIYFNDVLIISQGQYVGDPSWPGMIKGMIGGSVRQVCASIGGGGVMDFETIHRIYLGNGHTFAGTNLERNLLLFRLRFPSVGIIDMDCEDLYDEESFVAFSRMLVAMGFGITFCPYADHPFWIDSLAALHRSNPGAVRWWNLQCYDGGYGNDPAAWAEDISAAIPGFPTEGFILAGDWADDEPAGVEALMSSFDGEPAVGGGFIWTLDEIILMNPQDPGAAMREYANAIAIGLGAVPRPAEELAE